MCHHKWDVHDHCKACGARKRVAELEEHQSEYCLDCQYERNLAGLQRNIMLPTNHEKREAVKGILSATIVSAWTLCVMIFVMPIVEAYDEAQEYETERLADAIFKAENSKTKPYGIMKDYCKAGDPDGQCRKGCVQTIEHAKRDWDHNEDFLVFLGSRYCPPLAHTLNRNWVHNVRYFYERR